MEIILGIIVVLVLLYLWGKWKQIQVEQGLDRLVKLAWEDPNAFLNLIETPFLMTAERFHTYDKKDAQDMVFGVLFNYVLSQGYTVNGLLKHNELLEYISRSSKEIFSVLWVFR